MKTATIAVRIDPDYKKELEELVMGFGITLTDAINLFLSKLKQTRGIPFTIGEPTADLPIVRGIEDIERLADESETQMQDKE